MQLDSQPSHPFSIEIKVKTLDHFKGPLPKYQTSLSSGFDVRAQLEKPVRLAFQERALIPTGLIFEIPRGFELQARPRSGLALKKGLTLMNSPGTIDADYRGEIKIIVVNFGKEEVKIEDQDRIAQIVLCPVYQASFSKADQIQSSERGASGFGSTGRK